MEVDIKHFPARLRPPGRGGRDRVVADLAQSLPRRRPSRRLSLLLAAAALPTRLSALVDRWVPVMSRRLAYAACVPTRSSAFGLTPQQATPWRKR
jgi:hypothetical protein